MGRIKIWISEHPYLSGGLVLGLILLFILRRNSAAGGSTVQTVQTGPSDALQAAELQAAAGVQSAQIAGNVAMNQQNAALTLAALQYGAQTTIASYQYQAQLQSILSGASVANNQTAAELALGLAQTGSTYGFSGSIGGLSFTGSGVSGAVVNQTTQQQQQQQAAAQQQTVANTIGGYYPVPTYDPNIPNSSFTTSNLGTSQPATLNAGYFTDANLVSSPGLVIPSADNQTYYSLLQSAYAANPTVPGINLDPTNYNAIANQAAISVAVENAYLTDPNSCHNTISTACGNTVEQLKAAGYYG